MDLWNVATPPADRNRLGFWHDELLREVAGREESLSLLPDVRVLYAAWKHLVHSYRVQDVNVNDARLVDVMSVYAVESLLSFNSDDFKHYGLVTALHPASLLVRDLSDEGHLGQSTAT